VTSCIRLLHVNEVIHHVIRAFHVIDGNSAFITVLSRTHSLSESWARAIQFTSSNPARFETFSVHKCAEIFSSDQSCQYEVFYVTSIIVDVWWSTLMMETARYSQRWYLTHHWHGWSINKILTHPHILFKIHFNIITLNLWAFQAGLQIFVCEPYLQ
jgi:hypothetical protein